jgi:hypothetical protein
MTDVRRVIIEEQKVEGKRLGRHVEHDEKSRAFAFGVSVTAMVDIKNTRHHRLGGPLNQGDIGSCTGNATAGACNTVPLHHKLEHLLKEPQAVELYALATVLDGFDGTYPPDDTGSSGLAAAQAAQQKGYITSYKHAFSVEEAVAALMVSPVITGVNWYEGFDSPDQHGMVSIAGQVRGGHEFEVLGIEINGTLDASIVEAENSWGTDWGKHGRFYFTVATWRQLLNEDGDVTVLVP